MATDWLTELEAQIERECGPLDPPKKEVPKKKPDFVIPKKSDDSTLGTILFAFVLVLIITLGGIWLWKGDAIFNGLFAKPNPPAQEQVQPQKEPWEEPWHLMSADIKAVDGKIEEVSKTQKDSEEKLDWVASRLALLGALHSNNFVEAQKSLPNANFIYPNREWQIDRLPENLDLTPEDRERLGRFVKAED